MKTQKKFGIGLSLLLSAFLFLYVGSSLISALTRNEVTNASYRMTALNTITMTVAGTPNNGGSNVYNFVDKDPNDTTYNYKYSGPNVDGGICADGNGITLSGPVPISQSDVTITATIDITLQTGTVGQNNLNCGNSNDVKESIKVLVPGTVASTSPGTGGVTSIEPTCESGSFTSLEWIFCPLFNIAADLTNKLVDELKDQLCFKVDESPTSARTSCQPTPTEDIKPAWSAIKNIVSALLVVVMLIAIFAQATSIGPFDAYTLRKLLPRIVAAVILIQISFYLFSWVVNLVDDLGEGLDSLLNAVFTRSSGVNLNDLGELLANANVGEAAASGVNWVVILGLIALGIASLPVLLLALFGAVIAIFVAFAVLIFRKVLIIALLLIAPVALLLWVLPNTERYWKMWWDNFLKILLMFPIIVLLIEAGRIFAFVAGPTAGNEFIALLIVMIGFFGPLLLLPRTFRWGGTLMAMAGQGLEKAGGSLGKPGKDYLEWKKGTSRWSLARQTRRGILERQAKTDFAKGLSMEGGKGLVGAYRGARGKLNRARLAGLSTKEGLVRQKALQSAQAEVGKVFEEERAAAEAELTQTVLPNFDSSQQDLVREAIALRQTRRVTDLNGRTFDFDGNKHVETHGNLHQRAALDKALVHGQIGVVDQYYTEAIKSGDRDRVQAAEFWKNANAAGLGEKAPHILKGFGVAVGSTEEAISKMHGHEIESILAEYSTRAAAGDKGAANALSGFLQRYQNARNNDNLRGNLDLRGIAAVDAFIGAHHGDPSARDEIEKINYGSADKRRAAESSVRSKGASQGWSQERIDNEARVAFESADREANRSRYQSPGTTPGITAIPLITIPGSSPPPPPASRSGEVDIDH